MINKKPKFKIGDRVILLNCKDPSFIKEDDRFNWVHSMDEQVGEIFKVTGHSSTLDGRYNVGYYLNTEKHLGYNEHWLMRAEPIILEDEDFVI